VRVIGVDLSLSATGLAAIDNTAGAVAVDTRVIKTKPDDGTLQDRHRRLEAIASGVIAFAKEADLVVIESPSYSSGGRGTWDRAGLWWWVVSVLVLVGRPIVEIAPKTRAKWATDNGNAGKNAVSVAIGRLWPDVELRDDNESDALVLATIGAQFLRISVPVKSWHSEALKKVVWPGENGGEVQGRLRDMRSMQ
jgi:crossover junction endodeoxyribonuclease RuvC